MSDRPKVMVVRDEDDMPVVFFGEDRFPHEVFNLKADFGFGDPVITLEIPVASVEFRQVG